MNARIAPMGLFALLFVGPVFAADAPAPPGGLVGDGRMPHVRMAASWNGVQQSVRLSSGGAPVSATVVQSLDSRTATLPDQDDVLLVRFSRRVGQVEFRSDGEEFGLSYLLIGVTGSGADATVADISSTAEASRQAGSTLTLESAAGIDAVIVLTRDPQLGGDGTNTEDQPGEPTLFAFAIPFSTPGQWWIMAVLINVEPGDEIVLNHECLGDETITARDSGIAWRRWPIYLCFGWYPEVIATLPDGSTESDHMFCGNECD